MSSLAVTIQVPGKLMLAGEYAVLKGGRALATTLGGYLTVKAAPSDERVQGFEVSSDLWRESRLILGDGRTAREPREPLEQVVLAAMKRFAIPSGRVSVVSDLKVSYGVGSSSALRLGVILALRELASPTKRNTVWEAARLAYILQRSAQEYASGYDIATQLLGGLVVVRPPMGEHKTSAVEHEWPGAVERCARTTHHRLSEFLHVFVGGRGAPTRGLLQESLRWLDHGTRWQTLNARAEELVEALLDLLEGTHPNLTAACAAMGRWRRFSFDMPQFPHELAKVLEPLAGRDEAWSYKTTGAGGEDAILLLCPQGTYLEAAERALATTGWRRLPFGFTEVGARRVTADGSHNAISGDRQ